MYKLLAILLSLFLSGCAINTKAPVSSLPDDKFNKPDIKLCLALSGGGLRSAVLSLGAFQQLEESNLLSDIDLVASVSGGGWPLYGLLAHMEQGIPPSALLDENSDYITKFDNTDFVSDADILGTGLVQLTLGKLSDVFFHYLEPKGHITFNKSLSNSYGSKIHKKFYQHERSAAFKHVRLNDVSKYSDWNFPYPIFIASSLEGLEPPKSTHEYNVDNLFELSPKWAGSPAHGYQLEFGEYLEMLDVVVASSGASDSPKTQNNLKIGDSGAVLELNDIKEFVQTPPHRIRKLLALGGRLKFKETNLFLSDGGFIENTGVLPLIRRKCDEIIAVDARLDPYMFNVEFHLLQAIIEKMGGKMEIPSALDFYSSDEKKARKRQMVNEGWQMDSHYYPANVNLNGHRTKIHFLKLGLVKGERYVDEISSFINENHSIPLRKAKSDKNVEVLQEPLLEPMCGKGGLFNLFETCSFPFSGTFITNYSPDESKAYRFLGKHLINVLVKNTNLANSAAAR